MVGKKEVQKTVAFRLNIAKAEERELYHAIMKHGRGNENDLYGSSGAYLKAALKHYHRQEKANWNCRSRTGRRCGII